MLSVGITWKDAPESQYPIKGQDYMVKCDVSARPPPIVDWWRNYEAVKKTQIDLYVVKTYQNLRIFIIINTETRMVCIAPVSTYATCYCTISPYFIDSIQFL